MTPVDEPTVGEQIRRLGDQITRLEGQVSKLITVERHGYEIESVHKSVTLLAEKIASMEQAAQRDRDNQIQTRRLVWTAFVVPLGLLLLQFYLNSWSK